ncbi:alpha/beta fold hydrolase [Marinobacter sp.]|uniref:alpha/beta fold hydrolase n=1 Tax=Marinobacter sp. TaxID=50741 RepID=UPI0034A270DB
MRDPATQHLTLTDGRNLSYSDSGTGEHGTWIHCHGIPGSRYELNHLNEELRRAGLRIIVPDRPGYGDSTPHPHYGFAQHSADLRQLADYLGLQRFSVSGFSGGGVFAMATAHDLGERVARLTIAATPAVPVMNSPFDYASELTANAWQAALSNPETLALELQALTESAEGLSHALKDAAGPDEARHLSADPLKQAFAASIGAALAQGPVHSATAMARDSALIANRWPFSPAHLTLPVRIIHGGGDKLVDQQHRHALLDHIPGSVAGTGGDLLDSAGHYAVLSYIWA